MAAALRRVGLLIGGSGEGKSTLMNRLKDDKHDRAAIWDKQSTNGTTKNVKAYDCKPFGGKQMTLWDSCGVNDKGNGQDNGIISTVPNLMSQLNYHFRENMLDFVLVTFKVSGMSGATSLSTQVAQELVNLKFVRAKKDAYRNIILAGTFWDTAYPHEKKVFQEKEVPAFYKALGAPAHVCADISNLPWCHTGAATSRDGHGEDIVTDDLERVVQNLPEKKLEIYEITEDDWATTLTVLRCLSLETHGMEGLSDGEKGRAMARRLKEIIKEKERQTRLLESRRKLTDELMVSSIYPVDSLRSILRGDASYLKGNYNRQQEKAVNRILPQGDPDWKRLGSIDLAAMQGRDRPGRRSQTRATRDDLVHRIGDLWMKNAERHGVGECSSSGDIEPTSDQALDAFTEIFAPAATAQTPYAARAQVATTSAGAKSIPAGASWKASRKRPEPSTPATNSRKRHASHALADGGLSPAASASPQHMGRASRNHDLEAWRTHCWRCTHMGCGKTNQAGDEKCANPKCKLHYRVHGHVVQ